MKKIAKMNEIAWLLGLILCGLGVVLCTKANFGLSMIAAPAYIIHVRLQQILSWYTQGTSEYLFQGLLLVILCFTVRRFRPRYLLSFATAFLAGLSIDGWLFVFGGGDQFAEMWVRILAFVIGSVLISAGVAFFFRSSWPCQMYELFVAELSETYHRDINKVKLVFDFVMLGLSLLLSLVLTHKLTGIGIGTVIVTFANAPLIKIIGKGLDRAFTFDSLFVRKDLDRKKP